MARQDPAQRLLTEQTLAGLRFVRNHIGSEAGLAGFLRPGGAGAGWRRVTGWSWKPVPAPALASLAPRGRTWELARYRAYQAYLAGAAQMFTIRGETYGEPGSEDRAG
jgi:hypothetical protein